ncbi:amidoligase family protein [Catenovulum sp. 2E275]|uniref:amidoligase family protein n=1 Tax=Catenovulum sp. 2E275 TaxID=2980497 RepID=UPI0021CF1CE4|nr:amidoligase family protein [Catenovulum sp. 2E275]MCU4676127.1 amidoligase family protein [Catenovulum sp. 2E275]
MQNTLSKFILPEHLNNQDNQKRKVGYELEFAGLQIAQVVDILKAQLNAELEPKSQAECLVISPTLGKFKVELDWQFAKTTAAERAQEYGQDKEDDKFTHWLTKIASQVVPVEIVCPPIEIENLYQLEPVVNALSDAGALGTEESVFYAFGVHINPELPDLSAPTIAAYIKAFCIAQDWLVKAHQVDPIRRVTPYIDLYPDDYIKTVFNYTDQVSIDQLISDYLQFNPTRNRALDLLPLFKFLDKDKINQEIKDNLVNTRPTFHYRLPNCEIDQTQWSLANSWNIWCVVEYLAHHPELLTEMIQLWQDSDSLVQIKTPSWHDTLDQIRQNLLSA